MPKLSKGIWIGSFLTANSAFLLGFSFSAFVAKIYPDAFLSHECTNKIIKPSLLL